LIIIDSRIINVRLIRHSRVGGNPGKGAKHWIPASAGMTKMLTYMGHYFCMHSIVEILGHFTTLPR